MLGLTKVGEEMVQHAVAGAGAPDGTAMKAQKWVVATVQRSLSAGAIRISVMGIAKGG